jgi:hypothetical protein
MVTAGSGEATASEKKKTANLIQNLERKQHGAKNKNVLRTR